MFIFPKTGLVANDHSDHSDYDDDDHYYYYDDQKNVNLIFSICFWIFPACGFCSEEWLNPHSSSVYIYIHLFLLKKC